MKKKVILPVFTMMIIISYYYWSNRTSNATLCYEWSNITTSTAFLCYERVYAQDVDEIIASKPLYIICDTFDFIPSEWILKWKFPFKTEVENSSCAVLLKEINKQTNKQASKQTTKQTNKQREKEQVVKWIVHPNKTMENLGCTHDTKECHHGPHFDKVRNIRINMPPCCRQKMLFVLEVLTAGFQMLKIPHVMAGGGVLGWARYGRMMPYDQDLDIFVDGAYWRTPGMMSFLEDIKVKYGFFVNWKKSHIGYPGTGYHFSVSFSETNLNGVDLWSWRMKKGKVTVRYFAKNNEWDYSVINPPRLVNFNGITTYVPNKPFQYVQSYYGKEWEQELQCKNVSLTRKCLN